MVLTTLLLTQTKSDVKDDLETHFLYGAVGTGSATPTAGDTTLTTEVFRKAIDEFDKSAASIAVASLKILTTEANGNTIREGGWLNQSSGGTLWTRNTLTAVNKTDDIQLFLDTSITITVEEV